MVRAMKLSAYLEKQKLSHGEFAKLVNAHKEAVRLWCLGERRPRHEFLARIVKATGGKVNATDFWQ
jgi:DNA-binding transcriptional regulator YiaG